MMNKVVLYGQENIDKFIEWSKDLELKYKFKIMAKGSHPDHCLPTLPLFLDTDPETKDFDYIVCIHIEVAAWTIYPVTKDAAALLKLRLVSINNNHYIDPPKNSIPSTLHLPRGEM